MAGSFCPIKPQLFASEQSEEVHRAKVAGSATTTTREEKDPPPFSMKTPLHLNEREEATDFFSWPNSFLFFFLLTVSWNCTLPLHSTPPPLFFSFLSCFLSSGQNTVSSPSCPSFSLPPPHFFLLKPSIPPLSLLFLRPQSKLPLLLFSPSPSLAESRHFPPPPFPLSRVGRKVGWGDPKPFSPPFRENEIESAVFSPFLLLPTPHLLWRHRLPPFSSSFPLI